MKVVPAKLKFDVPQKFDFWVIFFLGLVYSFLLAPSLNGSLGITSLEDGPIQPSLVFKSPQNFTNDFHASEFQRLMWTTSTKWLPALLFKYLNVDPIMFHVFFTYFQTVMILIGVFYLSKSLFGSRTTSYISVILVIAYSPFFNNFASYGDEFFMPYGTWISIGPLLMAWSYYLGERRKATFMWLAVGSSIHPAMALCASLGLLSFTFIKKFGSVRAHLKDISLVIFAPLFFSSISAFVSFKATAQVVPKEWFVGARQTMHWFAWKLNPNLNTFQTTIYTMILTIFMGVLINSSYIKVSKNISRIYNLTFLTFTTCYLLQAISYSLNIRQIYSISFGRFSIFSSILIAIIFAHVLSLEFSGQLKLSKIKITLLLITILFPSILILILMGFTILALEAFNAQKKNSKIFFGTASAIILVCGVELLRANYNKSWLAGSPFFNLRYALTNLPNFLTWKMLVEISFYLCIPVVLFFAAYGLLSRTWKKYFILFTLIFLATTSLSGRFILSERRDRSHSDWIQVQIWARDHSPFGAKFIVNSGMDVYESWTTLARRPRLIGDLSADFLYFYTKEDATYDLNRSKLGPSPSAFAPSNTIQKFYTRFSKNFGADYLVWRTNSTRLTYKQVYKNSKFIVYKLPESLS